MAQLTQLSRHLQLQFQVGTTSKGLPKLQNHNFAHLAPGLSDDDALSVGQALAQLFALPVYQIAVVEQNAIAPSTTSTGTSSATTTASSTTN